MSKSHLLIILLIQGVEAPPFRFWIGVMIFFTTFTNYMLRANMSVSIIKMVGKKESKFVPVCLRNESSNATTKNVTKQHHTQFDWDENQVGDIMAGYFYGYMLSLIPAGLLSEMIGPWHVIMWSSLASAVVTVLTPLSALESHWGVVACRVFIGILGGVAYPAVHTLVAKWAPPKEKGKFAAAMMGNNLGTVFSFNLVDVVTDLWGWPWGFYVVAIVMCIFCVAFFFIVADNPGLSKWTSQEECNHIQEAQEGHLSKKKAIPPYRKILTSVPFIAMCIAQFGNLWALNLNLSYAPKFLAETLGFNLKASAGLAALPYIARLVSSFTFGFIVDYLRRKELMTITRIRKFFIVFSHFIPAACFFLIRAAGCNPAGVVTLLIANQGFNGACSVSHLVNAQDLTPNFAGSCFAVMNAITMTTGIFVPKITGAINVHYNRELSAATLIFTIGGIVLASGGIVFVFFGSGQVQSWNEIKEMDAAPEEQSEKT